MNRFKAQHKSPEARTESHAMAATLYAKTKDERTVLKMASIAKGYMKSHQNTTGTGV
jgi:hypothetical protein